MLRIVIIEIIDHYNTFNSHAQRVTRFALRLIYGFDEFKNKKSQAKAQKHKINMQVTKYRN